MVGGVGREVKRSPDAGDSGSTLVMGFSEPQKDLAEGRTLVSSRKLESKEGPQGRIEVEETMQEHTVGSGYTSDGKQGP